MVLGEVVEVPECCERAPEAERFQEGSGRFREAPVRVLRVSGGCSRRSPAAEACVAARKAWL